MAKKGRDQQDGQGLLFCSFCGKNQNEVKKLVDSGISFERLISLGLEYKYISLYLMRELNYNEMFEKLNTSIHNFAKRQMTWFRKMEREGVKINWLNGADFDAACILIDESLSTN